MANPYSQMSTEELLKLQQDLKGAENPYARMSTEELLKKRAQLQGESTEQHDASPEDEQPKKEISRSAGKAALRQVGRLGRSTATGLAGLADIPNLAALGLHAAGLKEKPTFYEPVAGKVQHGIDTLTGGKLKPENDAEEWADFIGEGLAPLALAPFTGGTSLTGTVGRQVAKSAAPSLIRKGAEKVVKAGTNPYALTKENIAANVGSSAALKSYLDQNEEPGFAGSLLASTIGGTAGRQGLKFAHHPKNYLAEGAGRLTRFSPEKYKAQTELGLPVSLGNVSKSEIPTQFELLGSKFPLTSGPLKKHYEAREAAIAKNLGVSSPDDLVGAVTKIPKHLVKKGAEGYAERAGDIFEQRKAKFAPREEKAINNKELVDVSNLINDLEHERSLSLTPTARSDFDRSKNGILLKKLNEYSPSRLEKSKQHINWEEPEGAGIGLHDLNKLREKALHESLAYQTPMGKKTPMSKEAAHRSEGLSKARHQFIEEVGSPSEAHNAREARLFWAKYKDEKKGTEKYVRSITGQNTDANAFDLLRNDEKYFRVARQGLPVESRPKLATAFISDLGDRQGRFNLASAHTHWTRLEDPVKAEFLKTLGSKTAATNFTKMMDFVGENKKVVEKYANTSNTTPAAKAMDLVKKIGTLGATAATGNVIGVVPALLGAASLHVASRAITNQDFMRRVNKVMTARKGQLQPNYLEGLIKAMNQTGRMTHRSNKSLEDISRKKED